MSKGKLGTIIFVIILASVLILILFSSLASCRFDTVRTGSMAPEIRPGDLTITVPIGSNDIKRGDVITYRSPQNNELICHRVIYLNQTTGFVQTKGDANEDPDPYLVPFENIVGRVAIHIPIAGYVVGYLSSIYGLSLIALIVGILILYWAVSDRESKKQNKTGGAP